MGGVVKKIAAPAAILSNPAVGSAVLGHTIAKKTGLIGGGGGAPEPGAPGIDPRINEIRERQVEQAKAFRANMGAEKAQRQSVASDDARRGLARQMAGISQAANQRGLTYSGLKAGAESQAGSEAAGELAAKKAQIGENLEEQAKGLESTAVTGAYQQAGDIRAQQDSAFQRALAERQRKSDLTGSVLGSLGGLAGKALG